MLNSRYAESLRAVVGGETKSYGFALVVWGAGEMTTAHHGPLRPTDVCAFVGGVFLAMALTILVSFGGLTEAKPNVILNRYAVGAVHLASVIGGVGVGWLISESIGSIGTACLATGFGSILAYQLLLGVEVAASIKTPSEVRRQDRNDHRGGPS